MLQSLDITFQQCSWSPGRQGDLRIEARQDLEGPARLAGAKGYGAVAVLVKASPGSPLGASGLALAPVPSSASSTFTGRQVVSSKKGKTLDHKFLDLGRGGGGRREP